MKTKLKFLSLLLGMSIVVLAGCSKKDEDNGEMTTKAKIDNNAPAAKTSEGAPPATDTPTPGAAKGARSKGQAPPPVAPGSGNSQKNSGA